MKFPIDPSFSGGLLLTLIGYFNFRTSYYLLSYFAGYFIGYFTCEGGNKVGGGNVGGFYFGGSTLGSVGAGGN